MKKAAKVIFPLTAIGLLAGFVNGLLGAAGGILVVMGLRRLFRKKAVNGHSFYASAVAVMLPISLFSAWQYARSGNLPPVSLEALLLPAAAGGALGAFLLPRIHPRILHRIFAAAVLISGIILAV